MGNEEKQEETYNCSGMCYCSMVRYGDSYTDVLIGDEVVVYFDGNIMETDPLQLGTVYAITLKTPVSRGGLKS